MNKVWIVQAGYDYEGYDVIKVFETKAGADAFVDEARNRKHDEYGYDDWKVDEWDIERTEPASREDEK